MYELILSNFAMHIVLDAAEAEHIKSKLQHKTVKKNTVLLTAGETCKNIYFVNKGCLRTFDTDERGEEHNILFCPENWWAVDIASFSDQRPAFYNISALEDTEVFYFSYPVLEQLYLEIPKLERFFRILTQNGFNLYQQRITSNLAKTAEERYELFHRQYPKLEQRIAQKQIASYLGITPVFLSMIRGRNG
ncbi:Crp/Fnr family transcriptional regulator [Mucilaginibacter jinjuensis]|uniref:Crp/Fnr family transcriptional regulator n=1 Tax=Mucilaginibacter jinjuensis TaxID=1176721 RepID=A0ABY7T7N6_9SPHI|nr:Crp/Fnr family transcriptional regulator [Mucilaginibacter jinjuensis]WCT12494.1 Crp/Fnr family transcriptional regulator [Mucilaginibacter jinjuensis]